MLKKLTKAFIGLSVLLVTFALISSYFYSASGPLDAEKTVIIEKGMGIVAITKKLEEEGVVYSRYLVAVPAFLTGQNKELKPGEYAFPASISPKQVVDALVSGDVVIHKLTVPEGLTSKQMVALINDTPSLEGEISDIPEEGSLLPETYYFTRGDSRQGIIDRMASDMETTSQELWQSRANDLPFETLEEAIILASIVEKEAQISAERAHIASVYINRLNKGMKLQADPTTIYAIELESGEPIGRPLYKRDLARDLPHNTYFYEGLPPTPIANPGRASIKAVLQPKKTDDLFFVARGDGGHYFAKTYREHQRNIVKYKAALKDN